MYGRRSINNPMSAMLHANDQNSKKFVIGGVMRFQNSKKSVIGGVMSVYTKNLGCSTTSAMMSLELIMVQMH